MKPATFWKFLHLLQDLFYSWWSGDELLLLQGIGVFKHAKAYFYMKQNRCSETCGLYSL